MTTARILRTLLLVSLGVCWLLPARAHGHTATLSVLLVQERAPGQFVISWQKTERIEDPSAAYDLLRPVFPPNCVFSPPQLDCGSGGLSGVIGFDGLGELSTSGMIQIEWADGKTRLLSLTAAAPHVRVSQAQPGATYWRSLGNFIGIGIAHIWLGWDHLLFILGLSWFLSSGRVLLRTVTAFTLAHSSTLAAATLGWFVLPAAPVEAVIALSIAFLAVEIVRELRTGRPGFTREHPWLIALAFGLIHGFGFASALSELRLAPNELPLALVCFNVGVELGQLLFVLGLLALRPLWRKLEGRLGARAAIACQYAMGCIAMYWFFERLALFLPQI